MTTHLLTFDIEEWFHLVGVRAMDDRSRWDAFEPTVEPLTNQILTLLDEYQAKGTFFMLGWVAERYPKLVQRIAESGHEVATHSYWHYEVYKHTPGTFRADMQRSVGLLENTTGKKVLGFRAPSFSLVPGCEWAWDVMLDLGLAYDASVFPVARAHGGYPLPTRYPPPLREGEGGGCKQGGTGPSSTALSTGGHPPPAPPSREGGLDASHPLSPFHTVPTPSGRAIRVLPMSVTRLPVLGKRLAFSGGGYFRVWPWWLVKRGFAEHDAAGRPAVVYLHPWDFAPGGPAVPMRPHQRFKCYFHRDQTEPRLRRLLAGYRFGRCDQALPDQQA